MQQEGVRKLGFTTKRTMIIAQQLYEGIKIGDGAVGLISYMRTDSMTLSKEAVGQARDYLKKKLFIRISPNKPIEYKLSPKNAQEAHEAIRPTDLSRSPQDLKKYLSDEQFKLYEMIWKRTLACQMTSAIYDIVSVDLQIGSSENIFRANGQTIKFSGFMSVYIENQENEDSTDNSKKNYLHLKLEINLM